MRVRRWWLSNRKNCMISKVRVFVVKFLTQPIQIICISAIPVSIIDLNFNPLSWLEWMKLLATMMNWSLSSIAFSISLPIVLSRTISLKDLGVSYDFLFSLRITTVVDLLKCKGQYPNSIQVLAMQIMLFKHLSSLRIILRWLHNNLSRPEIEVLLQFAMAILNSSFKNRGQGKVSLSMISSRILMSTWWWRAVLKVEWSVFYRLSMS